MITYEEIVSDIWALPETNIIELDSKVSDIIRAKGTTEPLEVANILEKLLPGVRRDLQTKIEEEMSRKGTSKFTFSRTSDNRLIGYGNFGINDMLSRLVDHSIELVSDCNRLSKGRDGREMFELTNFSLISQIGLKRPVRTELDFKSFVADLYRLFYDSAGGLNLRIPQKFIKVQRGTELVNKDDVVIFDIKHFRSQYEHDPELNDNPEKKRQLIEQACRKYVDKPTLIGLTPEQFLTLQEKLINNVNSFLAEIRADMLT
jgi:hypothetical protein